MKRLEEPRSSLCVVDDLDFDDEDIKAAKSKHARFCISINKSFTALSRVFKDSTKIVRALKQDPFSAQFRKPLMYLAIFRFIWLFLSVGSEIAVSFPFAMIMNAMQEKNSKEFYDSMMLYLIFVGISGPFMAFDKFLEGLLCARFREATSKILINRYHQNNNFYYISSKNDDIDNPGQRLDQDVEYWTWAIVTMSTIMTREFIRSIGWLIILSVIGASIIQYAFCIAMGALVFGVAIFAGKLTHIAFMISMHSASFRAGLIRTKDHGETIAFYQAAKSESYSTFGRLMLLVFDLVDEAKWTAGLAYFQCIVNKTGVIIPLFLLFPMYNDGKLKLGEIMQSIVAFTELLVALTLIVNQMNRLANIQAGGRRVAGLIDAMKEIEEEDPLVNGGVIIHNEEIEKDDANMLVYDGIKINTLENKNDVNFLVTNDLSIIVPNTKSLLLYKLNMTIEHGQNLLIVGPSGCGKSSLLRVLSGLWKWGGGSVNRLDDSEVMFLPQKPYLPILNEDENTLKNQLLFPKHDFENENTVSNFTDEECKVLLQSLGLGKKVKSQKLGQDWGKVLSLGEQQRLSFGRVCVAKPKMAFLDEATSALDVENQRAMYQLLQQQNITYLSVGHRFNLIEFHDTVLEVFGDGTWKLLAKEEYLAKKAV